MSERRGAITPREKLSQNQRDKLHRQFVFWDNVRCISETVANRLYGPMGSKDDK